MEPGSGPTGRILKTANLRVQVADNLRARLFAGEWDAGHRLPTEGDLALEYGVSRATIRAALQQLEAQGLTKTKHGMGTYASPYFAAIKAGLQELRSMNETIRDHGMEPGVEWHLREFRPATEAEAKALDVAPGTSVLATERAILADGKPIAFSYEAVPARLLPKDLDPTTIPDSMFALLDQVGAPPRTSVAEIHAATGPEIGWGDRDPGTVYVYLHQVHYDAEAKPVVVSRSYYHEGGFQFSVLRVR
jgi:DNA-binding GntR family transcriptional regulator